MLKQLTSGISCGLLLTACLMSSAESIDIHKEILLDDIEWVAHHTVGPDATVIPKRFAQTKDECLTAVQAKAKAHKSIVGLTHDYALNHELLHQKAISDQKVINAKVMKLLSSFVDQGNRGISWQCFAKLMIETLKKSTLPEHKLLSSDFKYLMTSRDIYDISRLLRSNVMPIGARQELNKYTESQLDLLINLRVRLNEYTACPKLS